MKKISFGQIMSNVGIAMKAIGIRAAIFLAICIALMVGTYLAEKSDYNSSKRELTDLLSKKEAVLKTSCGEALLVYNDFDKQVQSQIDKVGEGYQFWRGYSFWIPFWIFAGLSLILLACWLSSMLKRRKVTLGEWNNQLKPWYYDRATCKEISEGSVGD